MSTIPPAYPTDVMMLKGVDPKTGLVLAELPCRKCGYNLRGLSINGRCPECGTPVGLSAQGDLLRYSHPRWLRTLQRGVKIIIAGIVVIVAAVIMSIAIAAMRGPVAVAHAIIVVGNILIVVGTWLLTEPDPSGIGEDRYGTSRKLIRIALATGVLSTVIDLIQRGTTVPPSVNMAFVVISGLAGIMSVIGTFAQLNYLSKLAARIPDRPLESRARFLMWAIGAAYGVLILAGVIIALALAGGPPPGAPGGVMFLGCFAGIAGLALLVFFIMYLLMLDKFRVRLGEQADFADAIWTRMETRAPLAPPPIA